MANPRSSFRALVMNKWFVLFWLIFGCAYITIYGGLYAETTYVEGLRTFTVLGIRFEPTMTNTASIIGLTYFWAFKGWGLFQAIALTLSILYVYNQYGFTGKFARVGKICLIAGSVSLLACVMTRARPEMEMDLEKAIHWAGALSFGVFYAASLCMVLLRAAKKSKRAMATFVGFVVLLLIMLTLLVIVGIFKGYGGALESIPMWGAYLIIFLLGYTNIYRKSLPEEAAT